MTGGPEVKATHAQLGLVANEVLGVAAARAIAARAAVAVAAIDGALPGSWISVDHELSVIEAVAVECGLGGVRRRVHQQVLSSADGPLLRPIRESAMRLLGMQPSSLLRFSAQGWRSSFRHCGELAWTSVGPRSGSLAWTATSSTSVLAHSQAWAECLAGAVTAIFDLCHTTGTVTVTMAPEGATYQVSW